MTLLRLVSVALAAILAATLASQPAPVSAAEPDPGSVIYVATQATPPAGFNGIFGQDDRAPVTVTTKAPYSQVVFILMQWEDGSVGACSGFMIGPHTVGTAAHCLYDIASQRGPVQSALVAPGANGTSAPFGTYIAQGISIPTGWATTGNASFDYGAITLTADVDPAVGTFGMRAEPNSVLQPATVTISGYPGEKPVGSQWSSTGKIDDGDARLLLFHMDVTHGNSGSPMWEETTSGPAVVGIVIMVTTNGNIAVRTNSGVVGFFQDRINARPATAVRPPSSSVVALPGTIIANPPFLTAPNTQAAFAILSVGAIEGGGDLVIETSGGSLSTDGLLTPKSCAAGKVSCLNVAGTATARITIPDAGNDISSVSLMLTDYVNGDGTVRVVARQGTNAWQLGLPVRSQLTPDVATTATSTAAATGSGTITSGSLPSSGFGLIVFGGGTSEQLTAASACPSSTLTFWVIDGASFITYIPGTSVAAVNAAWIAKFGAGIPAGTAIVARCR